MEVKIYSEIYDLQKSGWWFGFARNKLVLDLVKKSCLVQPEKIKLLDIGSSEGAFIDEALQEGIQTLGIDIDDTAIEFCKKRGLSDIVQKGSIFNIPYPDNSFDVVTLLDIVEHVDEPEKGIKEVFRVLRPEGIVIMIVPAYQWLWSKNDIRYHHKMRYSKKKMYNLIAETNLTTLRISFFNMFLFPVFVLAILLSNYGKKEKKSVVLKPVPSWINFILKIIMKFEIFLITRLKFNLFFGSSIILIASKS